MYTRLIEQNLDDFIRHTFREKTDLKNFLLRHERKQLVIDNIDNQIRLAELGYRKLNRGKILQLIEAGCKMFVRAALQHAEEARLSEIAKKTIEMKAHNEKEVYEMISADTKKVTGEGI